MSIQRIRQFIAAVTARIEPRDRVFLRTHLSSEEEKLFWAMGLPEQRHAFNTAYTALKLAAEQKVFINRDLLIRCALLHDVGKQRGDIRVLDKVFTVLADRFFSATARRWAKQGQGGWMENRRHALYVYYCHPLRGEQKLKQLGLLEVAAVVARHHEAPAENDVPELRLLRKADALN